MTAQSKVKALLEKTGIAAREIQVFGSQILITCASQEAAQKFAGVIANFARVRSVFESLDYAKANQVGQMSPTMIKVWRVSAVI